MFTQERLQVIDEPEKSQLLSNETRRRIIYGLTNETKSISQLANELGKTPATIHYHMIKLENAGFVGLAKTRIVNNNLIEKFYKLIVNRCLVGLDFSMIGQRGPVPPKGWSRIKHTIDDEFIDRLFSQLRVHVGERQKRSLTKHARVWFDVAAFDAERVWEDMVEQIRLDLSAHDRYKLREIASLMPTATLCYMLREPQSRRALATLIREFSKLHYRRIHA
jgi:predicted transcriptional regulator